MEQDERSALQQSQKFQQIKIIHNQNNNSNAAQLRASQIYKGQQKEGQGKFINTYLNSVAATPSTQTMRSSLTKNPVKDDPAFQEFSKNFYNQVGLSTNHQ